MEWNEHRTEQLKTDWAEGYTALQIASRLGGITRSAVIGKIHRLGLSARANIASPAGKRRRRRVGKTIWKGHNKILGNPAEMAAADAAARAEYERISKAPELEIPLHERKTILTLQSSSCRWPIGDPKEPGFHFCGKHKVTGLPYCEWHYRRAYQPPQPRRVIRTFGVLEKTEETV